MTRVILFIIVAGNIMWGTTVVCGFAAIPGDPAANSTMQSGRAVSLYFPYEQPSSFANYPGREDVPLFNLIPKGHGYAGGPGNSFLVADSYVCRTPKGDCSTGKTNVKQNCYCPNGEDGTVVRIRSKNSSNNNQGSQSQTNPIGNNIDTTSSTNQTPGEIED